MDGAVSIIVPVLNEEPVLAGTLACARGPQVREVIVVDGGSTDGSREVALRHANRVLSVPQGRALQMNAGAAAARGSILLFLHADTVLPEGFDDAVVNAMGDTQMVGGRFDVRLEPGGFLLWLTGTLINLRSRLTRISTGDQAIFVRACQFAAVGGFPLLPLMEDVAFSTRLKRRGKIACLRERVMTSSRRWRKNGVIRTVLLMWALRFLYACGVPARRLRHLYVDTR